MLRIAVTGHMNLTPKSVHLVYQAIAEHIAACGDDELVGVSCIARGADSIFAQVVLDLGGDIEVVIPAVTYREKKVEPDHAAQFDELVRRAARVRLLPFQEASRDAYEAANEVLLSSCDRLVAIWDGQPGLDKGGTADVVMAARSRGIAIYVIWPAGAARG